ENACHVSVTLDWILLWAFWIVRRTVLILPLVVTVLISVLKPPPLVNAQPVPSQVKSDVFASALSVMRTLFVSPFTRAIVTVRKGVFCSMKRPFVKVTTLLGS